ncbi:MAG: HAMP domain-containing sensor histidine kinase, partial [Candidatus Hydrogenedentota bacterium]
DNGTGIHETDLPNLFDRFSQVRSDTGRSQTGLGLSIVKGIVEEHGGRVQATNRSSEDGGGARFEVILPLAGPVVSVSVRDTAVMES